MEYLENQKVSIFLFADSLCTSREWIFRKCRNGWVHVSTLWKFVHSQKKRERMIISAQRNLWVNKRGERNFWNFIQDKTISSFCVWEFRLKKSAIRRRSFRLFMIHDLWYPTQSVQALNVLFLLFFLLKFCFSFSPLNVTVFVH